MEDIPRNALYACGVFFMGGRMNRIMDSFRQLCLEGKKEQETDFFREVQNGVYWIPVKYDSKEDMQLQICMIKSARGRTYIPAFLDRESCRTKMRSLKKSLRFWLRKSENTATMRMHCATHFLLQKKQGIAVVNEAKEQAEKINKEAKEKADKTIKDADALAAKKREQADKTLADANAKAKQIVGDATAKSEEIHTAMMQRTEREQIVLQRTRKEVEEYTAKILAAYNAHIETIKGIPAQCENEFVISTAKEVEGRKPEDSAFAKKPAEKEAAKQPEKKPEAKPEAKPAPKVEEKKTEEPFKAVAKEEKQADKKKENAVHKGDSVLFNLNSEKGSKEKHESLEFGNNK